MKRMHEFTTEQLFAIEKAAALNSRYKILGEHDGTLGDFENEYLIIDVGSKTNIDFFDKVSGVANLAPNTERIEFGSMFEGFYGTSLELRYLQIDINDNLESMFGYTNILVLDISSFEFNYDNAFLYDSMFAGATIGKLIVKDEKTKKFMLDNDDMFALNSLNVNIVVRGQ